MAKKIDLITELYRDTAKNVSRSPGNWIAFLHTAANNYKYSFDDQILILAQHPRANACADIEFWNTKFRRWVNKGAKGIALIEDNKGHLTLKHVFDISDTNSRYGNEIKLWQMEERFSNEVIEALEAHFGELAEKGTLEAAILSAAENAAQDNMADYLSDLLDFRTDSFLEELDDLNVEVCFKTCLKNSVSYMMLTRCGIDTDGIFSIDDFRDIVNFNTFDTITRFGAACSDISEMGLREIESTVKNLQIAEKKRNRTFAIPAEKRYSVDEEKNQERMTSHHDDNLQRTKGLQPPKLSSAETGTGSAGEIRTAEEDFSEKPSEGSVHISESNREADGSSGGSRAVREGTHGASDRTDGENRRRNRTNEGDRPDEMGRDDEFDQALSGGNGVSGADLQLNNTVKSGGAMLPDFLDEKLIMGIVSNQGDDLKFNKSQIELFFSMHPEQTERANYLKSAYQDCYTEILIDGKRVGYKPVDDGLLMWEGAYLSRTAESVFSWSLIAEFTGSLIDKKEYSNMMDIKRIKSQNSGQMSLFDFQNSDAGNTVASEQISFFRGFEISQQVLDEAICLGGNEPNGLARICAFFAKDYELHQNADFLKKEYGRDGKGFIFDSHMISVWYDENGIRVSEGRTALGSNTTVLTWVNAAVRVRELLDAGRYVPQSVLDLAEPNERKELSEKLWYLVQDFSDEARSAGFIPTVQEIYNSRKGFPKESERLSELIKDPAIVESLINELTDFNVACQDNKDLLRFRFHRPTELLEKLHGLKRIPLNFEAKDAFFSPVKQFISDDEIDNLFIGGGSVQHSKFRIYSYFLQNHTSKERATFLKHEYGDGGHGRLGFNEWHDSKGISYSREDSLFRPYDKVLLKWEKVEKRIGELIRQNRYMTEQELAYIPTYEKEEVAKAVYQFFSGVSDNTPCPFPRNFDYWEGVKYVSDQLSDPAKIEGIYEMMLPVWQETKQDERNFPFRKQGFENLCAFRDGTFTLFGKSEAFSHSVTHEEPAEEKPIDFHDLAVQLNAFYKQYDPYDYKDNLELGNTEIDAISSLEMQLQNIHQRFGIIETLQLFLDDTDPDEEIAVDLELFIEELQGLSDDDPELEITQPKSEPIITEQLPEIEPINSETVLPAEEEPVLIPAWEHKKKISATPALLYPDVASNERNNYRITDDELGFGGAKQKYNANISAIKLLKELESESRLATTDEQEVLSRYVGWGGISQAFDDRNNAWANEYVTLKSLLDEDEYTAARESTLTAFYTSPVVIKAMYKAVENMGFINGNILEPSCGTGNFFGMLPESMLNCKMYGVELDSITGRIARQLYQKNSIAVQGYEKTDLPDSFFDLSIGNVPFGQFKVSDKRYDRNNFLIHDYFFAKTLDKVRPGGIVAFITSKGTMDKENPAVRKYIAQRADLLGAIRLPNNAFKSNAGTEVTADIIFLQKRDRIVDIEPDWVHLDTNENGIVMNRYFIDNPDMIMGEMVMESTQYGMDSTCKPYDGAALSSMLIDATANIHAEFFDYESDELAEEEDLSIPADPSVRNFSFVVADGKLYYRENARMKPVDVSVTASNRIRGMIELRDCVRQLIEYQTEDYPDYEIEEVQNKLNTLYDTFNKKYGLINSRANNSAFSDDSSYCLLCSLEIVNEDGELIRKADMFTKRTIKPHVVIISVDTASEALAVSIAERAKVDMDFMSKLSSRSAEEIENELTGVIFRIPSSNDNASPHFVTADEYLSGNVREKLNVAKLAAQNSEIYNSNVKALEAVQPADLSASEISVRLGATWLPTEIVQEFMFHLLDTPRYCQWNIKVHYSELTGEWNIEGKSYDRGNIKATKSFGTDRINAYKVIEETLNLRDVRIFDYVEDADGKKTAVLNKKETAIAQAKQEQIKAEFAEWIWTDPFRREKLVRMYNDKFNSIRSREYDGQHITFSGINPEITLRTHQVNAIARIMYGGNTLLAHVVGAGKTFEMVAAAMESKRLGLCHKSLFVVPNHLTEQWASEFLQLYPSANILVATKKDFETKNRKKFCGRIATGDYDAVIIGHTQFERIPVSIERQRAIFQQQLDEILNGIADLKANRGENFAVKQLEKTRKTIQLKLEKLNDQSRKDDVVTFEELGVDRIFVDEAHYYKNLFLYTKMRNVGGIAQTEAQKSSDLYVKCRYLDEITGGRGIIFATGTPISNSMVEMYTMQRYLQYMALQRAGLQHFDAWASTFGETVTAIELAPEGTGYRAKTRFAKFYNLPELMTMFRQVADIQTADMLNLPVPKANYHNIVIKPSELQVDMVADLSKRADRVRNKMVDAWEDNMLKITNDGRKLALDQRLMNDLLPDSDESKAAVCSETVYQIWYSTREERLTQLIFCDLSTPHGDGKFNVYDDIRGKLTEKGIPHEEVAFIHEADSESKKKELFAKVRSGQVRVMLGSTPKMGAGTNVQDKLIASHDLDCPWRPSDLEQRGGRIIRQGNQNPEVGIYRYVTEQTFDAYSYQLVENKQKFISQIMTSKSPVRCAEDIDETSLSYAEIKMLATGNPHIKEKMDLDIAVSKLKVLKQSHLSQKYDLEDRILKYYPQEIKRLEERITGYKEDIVHLEKNTSKDKEVFSSMTIRDFSYMEKADAGKAIIEECCKMASPDAVVIGKYRGFKMELSFDTFNRVYCISLKNKLHHSVTLGTDIHGNITRLDNTLDSFPDKLQMCEEQLCNTRKQLDNAVEEAARPFPKEEELRSKSARLDELNIFLNMDQQDHEILDGEPDECFEEVPIKAEKAYAR
ncbi:MAG: DNA methylase [Clostridiales bacterium 43-6]|nr:MAG: DNA methylase [Clostridiales bacterium 43-6]